MANAATVGVWNGARSEMERTGWQVVRTLGGGTDAMRKARELFTPRIEKERKRAMDYDERLLRSTLFPAYQKTVSKIAGLPFGKAPTVGTLPSPLDRIELDADREGSSLAVFAQRVYRDAIDRGIGLFLVDNVPDIEGMPLPEADEVDARPYFTRIEPDNLVGFQTQTRFGREVVTELRYREWLYRPDRNGFDSLVERVRVWDEQNVEVWEAAAPTGWLREASSNTSVQAGSYVLVSKEPHGFPKGIPLVVVYTNRVGALQATPPLLELAWLNVAHWNSSSIHGEALHYSRSPILTVTGVTHETAEAMQGGAARVGPGTTFADTSPDAELGFVEIAGTSLQAGERHIDTLRMQMEALGMQPLLAAGGPDTATGEIRADMAEKSEAQTWVEAMEWALYRAYQFAAAWLNVKLPDDFNVTLWKESSLLAGRAQDLPMLQADATASRITLVRYLTEAKRRGLYADDMDPEEEAAEVEAEAARSTERQMEAMAARMVAERPGEQPPTDDPQDPEDDPAETEEAAA